MKNNKILDAYRYIDSAKIDINVNKNVYGFELMRISLALLKKIMEMSKRSNGDNTKIKKSEVNNFFSQLPKLFIENYDIKD